jgi:hypothetical protein
MCDTDRDMDANNACGREAKNFDPSKIVMEHRKGPRLDRTAVLLFKGYRSSETFCGASSRMRIRIASRNDVPESTCGCLIYFAPEPRGLRRPVVELTAMGRRRNEVITAASQASQALEPWRKHDQKF